MNRFIFSAFVSLSLLKCGSQVLATPITFQSPATQASLIELYTSEGCSSCPPAEAWLSKLKDAPGLWRDFVPVAFHVDYWDYLGWRDPWSARQFTARQQAWARSWGTGNVYTPGFVLKGLEWRGWSERRTLPREVGPKAGGLTVSSEDTNHWQVSFVPATPGPRNYDAYGTLLASGLSSEVKAGENRGRRLDHDFVVLVLVKGTLANREGSFRDDLTLARPNQKADAGRLGIAVWVTRAGSLEPVQAVGGWLRP